MAERAVEPVRPRLYAAREGLGLDRIEIAPPEIAVTAPLRMQRLGAGEAAPQPHAGGDETLAEAVEELVGGGAAQPLMHRPHMEIDDAPPERVVEAAARRWL